MSEAVIPSAHIERGAGIGRSPAFGPVAAQCSVAKSLPMRQIRDSEITGNKFPVLRE